jgi:hypothetical protein
LQRCGQCHVAAVGEGCDDQAAGVAQVLVAVWELGGCLFDQALVAVLFFKCLKITCLVCKKQ